MDVCSELIKAQAELLAADPATHIKGRIYSKDTAEPLKVDDGTNFHVMLTDRNFMSLAQFPGRALVAAPMKYEELHLAYQLITPGNPFSVGPFDIGQPLHIDTTQFRDVAGCTKHLRLKVQIYTNDVAPGKDLSVALYPITRPATSGGSGAVLFTFGTMVVSSEATFTAPTVDAMLIQTSADFDIPTTGHFLVGIKPVTGNWGEAVPGDCAFKVIASLQLIYKAV